MASNFQLFHDDSKNVINLKDSYLYLENLLFPERHWAITAWIRGEHRRTGTSSLDEMPNKMNKENIQMKMCRGNLRTERYLNPILSCLVLSFDWHLG